MGFGIDRSGAASGSGGSAAPITISVVEAKGDLLVGTADDAIDNLAVGANDTILMADSAEATGVKWATPAQVRTALDVPTNAEAVLDTIVDAKGDLIVGTAADTPARKAVGTNGMALVADSSQSDGLLWAALALQPGGRLSLTTATPVTTADVTGATTVYYTPYKHNVVMLYDGAGWIPKTFTELSQATTDDTKSPAAVAASKNYDVFVWNDSGTLRATRGPTWDSGAVAGSDTARGTGAGSTELELFEGRYVNKNDITNGPAARRGLYVGTIRSNASSQINDSMALRHVWNMHNRVLRPMKVVDTADSWNYSTASFQQANANAANQLDIVRGLNEDSVVARVTGMVVNSGASFRHCLVGVGIDSTTVNSGSTFQSSCTASQYGNPQATYAGFPGLGRHILVRLERGAGADTQTWIGDDAVNSTQINGEMLA